MATDSAVTPAAPRFFHEAVDEEGRTRDHYRPVQEWFDRLTLEQVRGLKEQRNESFRRQGTTFTV